MIIRSKDKKHITTDINLEIVTNTYYPEDDDGDVLVESKIYNSVGLLLATYSTEEKAIKVLDMIQEAFYRQWDVENKFVDVTKNDTPIFQMPQDEEVEV